MEEQEPVTKLVALEDYVRETPFVRELKTRLENYPDLYERYAQEIVDEPMTRTAVTAILNVCDLNKKVSEVRSNALELLGWPPEDDHIF